MVECIRGSSSADARRDLAGEAERAIKSSGGNPSHSVFKVPAFSLLSRRRLLLGVRVVRVFLVRFVMADDAARRSA
jgi:hypothetical protein